MSWFDTPDSWWDKYKTVGAFNSSARDTWDLNRDNVPEEYHWPDRLRASFTIRVRGLLSIGFQVIEHGYYFHPPYANELTDEMLEGYSIVDNFHELICVDVELPVDYSLNLLRVWAEGVSYGYDHDYYITEAEIHNIQFWSVSPSAFWQKYVNTYET